MLCFLLRSGVFHIVLAGSGGQRDPQKTGRKVFISFATPNRTGNGATLLHDGASFSPVVCVCVCFFLLLFCIFFASSVLACWPLLLLFCCFFDSIRSCFVPVVLHSESTNIHTHTHSHSLARYFPPPKAPFGGLQGGGELSCVCVAAQLEFEVGATVLSSNDQKPK